MNADTVFETERLLLRPFTLDDVEPLHAMLSDPESMRYSTCGPLPYETVLRDLKYNLEIRHPQMLPLGERMIVRKSDARVVGYCQLQREADGQVTITYGILPDCWGKGYAPEACRALLDHGFRDLALDEIVAIINPENHRSERAAEKMGLRRREGGVGCSIYSLKRSEYLLSPNK